MLGYAKLQGALERSDRKIQQLKGEPDHVASPL
jgi:hypothetical protein